MGQASLTAEVPGGVTALQEAGPHPCGREEGMELNSFGSSACRCLAPIGGAWGHGTLLPVSSQPSKQSRQRINTCTKKGFPCRVSAAVTLQQILYKHALEASNRALGGDTSAATYQRWGAGWGGTTEPSKQRVKQRGRVGVSRGWRVQVLGGK